MSRELRISVLIFLTYFIYGLTSLVKLGAFVTPYFLNNSIFVVVAFVFLALSIKKDGRFFLVVLLFTQILAALSDIVTTSMLADRLSSNALLDFVNGKTFIITSFFAYFIGLSLLLIPFQRTLKSVWKTVILGMLIVFSMISISAGYTEFSKITIPLFLLLYALFYYHKTELQRHPVGSISALFLLVFLLDLFKYLV